MINSLGVNISIESKKEILKKISSFLSSPSPRGRGEQGGEGHYIVTPNPEFLLAAQQDEEFFYILNKADIAVPDGVGLSLAALTMGKVLKRISGIDLIYDICQIAAEKGKSIFLLGGGEGVAARAAKQLQKLYPNLKIVGAETGLKPDEWEIKGGLWTKGEVRSKKLEVRINESNSDILFVAFGHVKQEKWIWHSLKNLPSVKIAMGVGGSFDFIAGNIKRAPKVLRMLGLEWLWRLLQEPRKRLPRIFNAVIKFPWEFLQWRFIKPFLYRPNVACLLFKREGNSVKVLLAERRDESVHWQLPQGGTDGEDLKTAGARELREEIGTDKFKKVAAFKNLYYYEFGEEAGRANIPAEKISGYRGQKQGLFIAEFTGQDSDITINYWDHRAWKWVALEDAVNAVHPIRKKAAEIFIDKFLKILKKEVV
jgi:N-acetylglucosaminyldiphosphoundecaprenol N-acetyl-beta-D-mannosaminyltransferase